MKYIYLILILFILSCKKKDDKPTGDSHNIKYEVLGFIDTEIIYDGNKISVHNNPSWSYEFTKESGKSLSLSARDESGTQSVTIRIYQDGAMTKSVSGYGMQALTDIVK